MRIKRAKEHIKELCKDPDFKKAYLKEKKAMEKEKKRIERELVKKYKAYKPPNPAYPCYDCKDEKGCIDICRRLNKYLRAEEKRNKKV